LAAAALLWLRLTIRVVNLIKVGGCGREGLDKATPVHGSRFR